MSGLHLLWLLSLYFAAVALAWMSVLIIARLLRDRIQRRRERSYAAVLDAYMRLMRGEDAAAFLTPYRRTPRLLAEALLQILDVVRGADRERMLEALRSFGMEAILRGWIRRGPLASRLSVIEALAAFPSRDNETALMHIQDKRTPMPVRIAAAKSLLAMGATLNIDHFIDGIRESRDPWSSSVSDILKIFAERQPAELASFLLRQDLPESLRVLLAESLGWSGDYRVLPAVCEAAMTATPATRAASLGALGRLMHPAVAPVVAVGLRDEDWRVRGAAAAAAGQAALTDLAPRVESLLDDAVWWVRFQAAESLAQMGEQGIGRLRQAASGNDGVAGRTASMTLAERGLQ